MSAAAQKLFDGMKGAVQNFSLNHDHKPGIAAELGAEGKRLGTQGAMEFASGLFNNNGFVPYGPGQYTPTPGQSQGQEKDMELANAKEHEHEMGHER